MSFAHRGTACHGDDAGVRSARGRARRVTGQERGRLAGWRQRCDRGRRAGEDCASGGDEAGGACRRDGDDERRQASRDGRYRDGEGVGDSEGVSLRKCRCGGG